MEINSIPASVLGVKWGSRPDRKTVVIEITPLLASQLGMLTDSPEVIEQGKVHPLAYSGLQEFGTKVGLFLADHPTDRLKLELPRRRAGDDPTGIHQMQKLVAGGALDAEGAAEITVAAGLSTKSTKRVEAVGLRVRGGAGYFPASGIGFIAHGGAAVND